MQEQFGMTVLLLEDDHSFNDKDRAKQILRELAALASASNSRTASRSMRSTTRSPELFSQAGVSAVRSP